MAKNTVRYHKPNGVSKSKPLASSKTEEGILIKLDPKTEESLQSIRKNSESLSEFFSKDQLFTFSKNKNFIESLPNLFAAIKDQKSTEEATDDNNINQEKVEVPYNIKYSESLLENSEEIKKIAEDILVELREDYRKKEKTPLFSLKISEKDKREDKLEDTPQAETPPKNLFENFAKSLSETREKNRILNNGNYRSSPGLINQVLGLIADRYDYKNNTGKFANNLKKDNLKKNAEETTEKDKISLSLNSILELLQKENPKEYVLKLTEETSEKKLISPEALSESSEKKLISPETLVEKTEEVKYDFTDTINQIKNLLEDKKIKKDEVNTSKENENNSSVNKLLLETPPDLLSSIQHLTDVLEKKPEAEKEVSERDIIENISKNLNTLVKTIQEGNTAGINETPEESSNQDIYELLSSLKETMENINIKLSDDKDKDKPILSKISSGILEIKNELTTGLME